MAPKKLTSIFIILVLAFGINAFGQGKTGKKGFAVLELFTSEGCSSCPPADELMGKLQKEYMDSPVYILSYHVDYWDKQGWKDIFSNADYTKRQYEYSKWLGSDQIYTPQLIVNGKTEYIGSQENIVRNAITNALLKPAIADLSLTVTKTKKTVTVSYIVNGTTKNSRLLIGIVQKSAQSNVKRGENAHRVLSHFQIVRHLQGTPLAGSGKGSSSLILPENLNTRDFEIIGFVQDLSDGSIQAVSKAVL